MQVYVTQNYMNPADICQLATIAAVRITFRLCQDKRIQYFLKEI